VGGWAVPGHPVVKGGGGVNNLTPTRPIAPSYPVANMQQSSKKCTSVNKLLLVVFSIVFIVFR